MQTIILGLDAAKLIGEIQFVLKSFTFNTKAGDDDRNCTIEFIGIGSTDVVVEFEDNTTKNVDVLPFFTLIVNTTLDRTAIPQYQITNFVELLGTAIGEDNAIKTLISGELASDPNFLLELRNLIEGEVDNEISLLEKHT